MPERILPDDILDAAKDVFAFLVDQGVPFDIDVNYNDVFVEACIDSEIVTLTLRYFEHSVCYRTLGQPSTIKKFVTIEDSVQFFKERVRCVCEEANA